MTSVGVVGLGYWGPNLARNFDRLPDAELAWVCDASEEALERWGAAFPSARTTGSLDELLADESLDAVVVATPVPTHAELATRVLEAGKHCFVEKPLGRSAAEAEARRRGRAGKRPHADGRPPARVPPGRREAEQLVTPASSATSTTSTRTG